MKRLGVPESYSEEPRSAPDLVKGSCRLPALRLELDLRLWARVYPAVPGENLPGLYHPVLPDLVQCFSAQGSPGFWPVPGPNPGAEVRPDHLEALIEGV